MRLKRSARSFMTPWKIAAASSDCAISAENLVMTSPGSLMDAPTHTRCQSRPGWNESDRTSNTSKTRILLRGWYQRQINCITSVQYWLNSADMVSLYLRVLVDKKTEPFGISERL